MVCKSVLGSDVALKVVGWVVLVASPAFAQQNQLEDSTTYKEYRRSTLRLEHPSKVSNGVSNRVSKKNLAEKLSVTNYVFGWRNHYNSSGGFETTFSEAEKKCLENISKTDEVQKTKVPSIKDWASYIRKYAQSKAATSTLSNAPIAHVVKQVFGPLDLGRVWFEVGSTSDISFWTSDRVEGKDGWRYVFNIGTGAFSEAHESETHRFTCVGIKESKKVVSDQQ